VNCDDTQRLLHAYADGELDLSAALALEQHLEECEACGRAHAELRGLRASLAGGAPYFEPPPGLRDRIRSAVRGAAEAPRPPRALPWRWLAIAASLAFLSLAGWDSIRLLTPRPADDLLMRELVGSHVRSQMLASHRVDVESGDQHTVKPWFEDKLDFSPPVPDLKEHGFELLGGRLDYLGGRPVAALVYRRRQHHINLYVWPSPDAAGAPTTSRNRGFSLCRWTQGGLTFSAISDVNEADLQEFARRFLDATRETR
jgi:anti-sigma factor RsiW